jgi:arginine metabolism regulation protein II
MYIIEERRKMSNDLTKLGPNWILVDIERVSLNVGDIAPLARFGGPFGVFNCGAPQRVEESSGESTPAIQEESIDIEELLRPPESCMYDENMLRWEDIEVLGAFVPVETLGIAQLNQLDQDAAVSPRTRPTLLEAHIPVSTSLNRLGSSLSQPNENQEAWFLLSHYRDKIVQLVCPMRPGENTPWISLLLPCAMNALAELTMGGTPTDAQLALLNGLLVASALHIKAYFNVTEGALMFSSETYIQRARYYIENSMVPSPNPQKLAKYKEILITLLGLTDAFV